MEQTIQLPEGTQLKLRTERFIGILAIGVTAFFLAVMQSTYHWDSFFDYLLSSRYINIFYGFVISLTIGAICLSLEDEKKP